ncbi:MAG TPA: sigma-70 family RNA polymerase sigma factor [Caulobacteraceae bacterium]
MPDGGMPMGETTASRAAAHDLDLVALAAGGGREAFGELVRRHGSAVRSLVRRMGAQPALADDIAQDAFLAAFERIAEFRGEGTFQAWVKRIAARLYAKRWRREAIARRAAEALEADDDPRVTQSGVAARIDLDQALASLGALERLCVSLCYGAGLSHSDAAEALGLPLGTVKSHVKRGLDKLKARLAPAQTVRDAEEANG